jgi:hypothetical protein
MRQTETNGWIVRNSSIITRRTLRLAVVPLSVGLVMMAGAARAGDDDRSISEKFVDSFYSTIRGTNLEKSSIDYRERSPLVVPPTLDLPPPAPSAGDGKIANWPKDPDERQRKAVIAAKKKNAPPPGRVLVSTDGTTGAASVAPQPINIAPPVEEAQATAGPKRPADAPVNSVAATDPIYDKPGDLFTGGVSALSDWGGGLFGKKATTVPVQPGTEPVREALTQPPVGYQVPSSSYAYGLPAKGLFDGQANPDRNPNAQASSASSVVH